MKLIIGLGNPGLGYQDSYHNLGFQVLEVLAQELGWDFKFNKKFNTEITTGKLQKEKIILVKPQTFMNNSGPAVLAVKQFFKIKPQDIWVIYDHLDLSAGQIRIRPSGSAGGHKGVQSIINYLHSQNFYHFRLGIGPQGQLAAEKYVLQLIAKTKQQKIKKAKKRMIDAILFCLENGIEKTMNLYN